MVESVPPVIRYSVHYFVMYHFVNNSQLLAYYILCHYIHITDLIIYLLYTILYTYFRWN